jgi:hypothetical protein
VLIVRLRALARAAAAVLVLAAIFAYLGDWLLVRVRPHDPPDAAVFETLTFYVATPFPQLGCRPCWYARRQPIHRVSRAAVTPRG